MVPIVGSRRACAGQHAEAWWATASSLRAFASPISDHRRHVDLVFMVFVKCCCCVMRERSHDTRDNRCEVLVFSCAMEAYGDYSQPLHTLGERPIILDNVGAVHDSSLWRWPPTKAPAASPPQWWARITAGERKQSPPPQFILSNRCCGDARRPAARCPYAASPSELRRWRPVQCGRWRAALCARPARCTQSTRLL